MLDHANRLYTFVSTDPAHMLDRANPQHLIVQNAFLHLEKFSQAATGFKIWLGFGCSILDLFDTVVQLSPLPLYTVWTSIMSSRQTSLFKNYMNFDSFCLFPVQSVELYLLVTNPL
jgi:hypothetical protein